MIEIWKPQERTFFITPFKKLYVTLIVCLLLDLVILYLFYFFFRNRYNNKFIEKAQKSQKCTHFPTHSLTQPNPENKQ